MVAPHRPGPYDAALAAADRMRIVPDGEALRLTWRLGTDHTGTPPVDPRTLAPAGRDALAGVGYDPDRGTEQLGRRGLSVTADDLRRLLAADSSLSVPVRVLLDDVARREEAAAARARAEAAARPPTGSAAGGRDRDRGGRGGRGSRLRGLRAVDWLPGLTGVIAVGLLVGMMFTGSGTAATRALALALAVAVVLTAVLLWVRQRSTWRRLARAQLMRPNRGIVEATSRAARHYRIGGWIQVVVEGGAAALLLLAATQDPDNRWVLLATGVGLAALAVVVAVPTARSKSLHDRERTEVERRGVRGEPGGIDIHPRERIEPSPWLLP